MHLCVKKPSVYLTGIFLNKLLLNQLKLEEKSVALCLFDLQKCLLSLDVASETINNCITVRTDK